MALSKIGTEAVEHISSSANATYLTVDASEQITVSSEGGAVTTSLQQGLAKAWVYFVITGGTPTISDSLNVSTITDLGVGDYKENLTSAMNNATFATSVTPQYSATAGTNSFFHQEDGNDKSTISFGISHFQNGVRTDAQRENGIIFGDLA